MRPSAFALILGAASSCSAAPEPQRPVDNRALLIRVCNAGAAEALIGRTADDATLERAKALAGARSVRILRPGEPQAMNFSGGRLNVEVDQTGKMTRFSCG